MLPQLTRRFRAFPVRRSTIAVAGVFIAAAAAPCTDAADPAKIRDIPLFEGLAERWEAAMASMKVPGFTVAVILDGELAALDAFGVRDLAGRPATPDTIYYIASCTKTYNGLAIVKLAEEGKIDLDAPVRTYLPQLKLPDEALASSITVRDLLCHRYGINSGDIVFQDAYTGQITDEAFFRLLAEAEISGGIEYSNVHYTILGRVIEAVAGKNWRDHMRDAIRAPAGMERTTAWASVMYGDDNSAEPMILLDGVWARSPLVKTDRTMHAAGGMGTSARDAATWLMLHMRGGAVGGKRLVSKASMDEVLKMQAKFDETNGSIRALDGFSVAWMAGTYRGLTPYYMHGGGYLGAAALIAFIPEKGCGVAVLSNVGSTGNGLCDIVSIDIFDRVMEVKDARDLLPSYEGRAGQYNAQLKGFDAARPNPATPGRDGAGLSLPPAKYAGSYANEKRGTVEFALADGTLTATLGDLALRLAAGNEPDAIDMWAAPDMQWSGRFELNAERSAVTAIIMPDDDGEEVVFRKVR